jgi:hypothetical protein
MARVLNQKGHATMPDTTPGEYVTTVNGIEIRKMVYGYAYPRNGNVHNPTPHTGYILVRNEQMIDRATTLREAKRIANEEY